MFDESRQVFIPPQSIVVTLEHSLISVAQWESKWKKPFLTEDEMSVEETVDYIRFMMIGNDNDITALNHLKNSHITQVSEYINDTMTATKIHVHKTKQQSRSNATPYAEVIYAQMFELGISMECQYWHLNRLLMLIRVMAIRANPDDKMSAVERNTSNAEINARRRAQMKSKG